MSADRIEAAGGVLWRRTPESVEVAVVHRPKYDDWTLPKGKLEPGEHPLRAAVREIAEETGFVARPGVPLGQVEYLKAGTAKRVRYWCMQAVDGEFTPTSEVDRLEWHPVQSASARLDFDRDRQVLDTFAGAVPDTWAVVLVRHASAGKRASWAGPDTERPLDERGRRQSEALAEVLSHYGVQGLHSADVLRCVETLRPLAERLHLPIEIEPALAEGHYGKDPADATRRLHELAVQGRTVVLSGQRGPIPGLVERICRLLCHDPVALEQTPKGGYVIVHLHDPDKPRVAAVEPGPSVP